MRGRLTLWKYAPGAYIASERFLSPGDALRHLSGGRGWCGADRPGEGDFFNFVHSTGLVLRRPSASEEIERCDSNNPHK